MCLQMTVYLLKQIKKRRLELSFKQSDMVLRVGMSRQQYQRLESRGNPRLDTLELIAKGLNSELMLIPQEKLNAVREVLASADHSRTTSVSTHKAESDRKSLADDPWRGLLDEDQFGGEQ